MRAIILAGGKGTRLRKRVPNLPKPMAPISGRPFLEYLLDKLIDSGIKDITLSVGYKAEIIVDHFGSTYKDANLNFIIEQEPLGTGGAIYHAISELPDDVFIVLNGDTFLNLDYKALLTWYEKHKPKLAMVLSLVPDAQRYGSVLHQDGILTGFVEKGISGPGYINAGVYIITPNIFDGFPRQSCFSFEEDVIHKSINNMQPMVFLSGEHFIDIGVPDDYEAAQEVIPQWVI